MVVVGRFKIKNFFFRIREYVRFDGIKALGSIFFFVIFSWVFLFVFFNKCFFVSWSSNFFSCCVDNDYLANFRFWIKFLGFLVWENENLVFCFFLLFINLM